MKNIDDLPPLKKNIATENSAEGAKFQKVPKENYILQIKQHL